MAQITEIMWRRKELLREILNECLDNLGELEEAWRMLTVAEWTKDVKFVNYALMHLVKVPHLAKEIERLKENARFYGELERKARREYYDRLIKCLAENLPF